MVLPLLGLIQYNALDQPVQAVIEGERPVASQRESAQAVIVGLVEEAYAWLSDDMQRQESHWLTCNCMENRLALNVVRT